MKRVLAIRHVKIEDLGIWEDLLNKSGFEVVYIDTPHGEFLKEPLDSYSLVVILGGYMGAYEDEIYPFLRYEFSLIEETLKKGVPLIGVCLGAQMLAKVLGAKVYRGEQGKEIGWIDVFKTGEHQFFKEFPDSFRVFQWHGDTFDLPGGAKIIYSSEKYENQAFVYDKAIGLQFHLEVRLKDLTNWATTYQDELKSEGIDLSQFFSINPQEEERLKMLSEKLIKSLIT